MTPVPACCYTTAHGWRQLDASAPSGLEVSSSSAAVDGADEGTYPRRVRPVEPELWKDSRVRDLCRAIISCGHDEDALLRLVRDLHTYSEIIETANRWAAVVLLAQDKTVRQVAHELQISSGTAEHARQWLYHGVGGFAHALDQGSQGLSYGCRPSGKLESSPAKPEPERP